MCYFIDMSNELTIKQEAFAVEYVANRGNGAAAYRVAYDAENMVNSTIWNESSIVLNTQCVAMRIQELRDQLEDKSLCRLDDLNNELMYARDLADEAGDHKELRANAMDRGKLHGLLVDKKELTGKDGAELNLLDTAMLAVMLTDEAKKQLNFEEA